MSKTTEAELLEGMTEEQIESYKRSAREIYIPDGKMLIKLAVAWSLIGIAMWYFLPDPGGAFTVFLFLQFLAAMVGWYGWNTMRPPHGLVRPYGLEKKK